MSVAREQPQSGHANGPLIGGVVVLLAALGVGGWALTHHRTENASVIRRDIVASVPVQGDVIAPPDAQANIPAPYRAPVTKVYTSIGQNVNRGESLVELSLPNVQDMYSQAQANVKSAETAYANARKQYDTSVANAQKALDNARAQAQTPSASTTTNPDGTQVAVTTPPADNSAAAAVRSQAEAALTQARTERDAALQPYQQQLDAARAAFKDAQAGRKQALVRSPIRGTVLALNAQPGKEVGEDQKIPVATVVDLDKLLVQGPLTNAQAGFVKESMPAVITVDGLPGVKFDGKVHSLTSQVTGTLLKKNQYVALVHVTNQGGKVKPGMKATVTIDAGEAKNVLAVPADAVDTDKDGRFIVRVNRGGQWQDQIVETGLTDGKYTEIKSGLKEGEAVQVKGKLTG